MRVFDRDRLIFFYETLLLVELLSRSDHNYSGCRVLIWDTTSEMRVVSSSKRSFLIEENGFTFDQYSRWSGRRVMGVIQPYALRPKITIVLR
jgi:hypothetical protein